MIYAQLNSEKICMGISQLTDRVDREDMIEISEMDSSLMGKRYEEGQWVEVTVEENTMENLQEPVLSDTEVMMMAIADLYEAVKGAE